jgi:hypothetical protein
MAHAGDGVRKQREPDPTERVKGCVRLFHSMLLLCAVAGGTASEIFAAMTYPATLVHISIGRPAADVYAYIANARNLTQWASGLSRSSLRQEGGYWIADSPMGTVKIKFTPLNGLGVVDHDVTTPDGTTFANPMRVQPNGGGAEVIFTLYRRPGVSDADFEKDAATIRRDLEKLKSILEK